MSRALAERRTLRSNVPDGSPTLRWGGRATPPVDVGMPSPPSSPFGPGLLGPREDVFPCAESGDEAEDEEMWESAVVAGDPVSPCSRARPRTPCSQRRSA